MRSVRGRAVVLVVVGLLLSGCGGAGSGSRTLARALPADAEFTHPGVLVDAGQLEDMRENVTAGKEPWLTAYLDMRDSEYGAYKYRAEPYEDVHCPAGGKAEQGCAQEREDALAAYTQALLYTVTGKKQHAEKAREIMDAWSAELKRHSGENAALQAGWTGSTWARAAEIVRYSEGAGWPADRVRRFASMLRTAHLPEVTRKDPDVNGDRDLVTIDAAIAIAVFLDDHDTFDKALARFRDRVPAYFYLDKDGRLPLTPAGSGINTPQRLTSYWHRQTTYRSGVTQETCRDVEHVGHAVAATAHIAETARHQGVDLYSETEDRLAAALDLHARLQNGERAPAWLCGGKVEGKLGPVLEIAVHRGIGGPATRKLAERSRPAGTNDLFVAWETLTHGG
ncbi:Alginate lyase [Streptomyces sp. DI166]|uniref:alginate lyase family protein n=1 Tax=Streptomyces sp. DI166 TaxID=1839783 RepID=UPI0007F4766B|nr:alginate lyase family protein [Streptomyces sp. DI166]SBT94269.1 Alginate lyase [Streptomyces sp. DI166]